MNYWSINMWNLIPGAGPESVYLNEEQYASYVKSIETVDYEAVVFFCHAEFEYFNLPRYEEIIELAKKTNKKVYAIVGLDHDYKDQDVEVINWPTNFFREGFEQTCHWYSTALRETTDLDKIFINNIDDLDYKYHFIYLNGKSHDHRCQLIDILARDDLLKYSAYSWHSEYTALPEHRYQFKWYDGSKKILDEQFPLRKDQGWLPPEYYQSFFQVVSETTVRAKFITEKTVIPLLIGKPFIIAAARGINKKLEELGFQLYDEIFDYSFDDIEDDWHRFEKISENVMRLTEVPISEIKNYNSRIRDKVLFNKQRAIELAISEKYIPEFARQIINHYDTTGHKIDWWLVDTQLRIRELKAKYHDRFVS